MHQKGGTVLTSIPHLRCFIPSVRFCTRLENTSPSAQCVGRGLSPYDKPKTSPQKNASTFEWCTPPVLTSISRLRRFIPSVRFCTRLENTSPSAQCVGRGLSPYEDNKKCLYESKLSPDTFYYLRTAHCHHESSSFPVYN